MESSHRGGTAVAVDAGAEADDTGAVADDAGAEADDAGAEAEYAGAEAENAGSEAGYLGRGYSAAKGDVSAIEGAGDFDGAAAGHGMLLIGLISLYFSTAVIISLVGNIQSDHFIYH